MSLENIQDKFIDLGNVPVGKTVTRKVRIRNSGRAGVQVKFDLMKKLTVNNEKDGRENLSHEQVPFDPNTKKKMSSRLKESRGAGMTSEEKDDSIKEMLSVEPVQKVSLAAGKGVEIFIKFLGSKRMSNFVEKIAAEVDSTILPLLFVRGSCVARQFRLDQNNFYFGTIVEGCTKILKIVLFNEGDFGAKFKWNVSRLGPHFRLEPVSGYCSPGMDITFDLIYQPKLLSPLLEAEVTSLTF